MSILITNDDGIFADGIRVLREQLTCLDEVWTVAPDRERNAVSQALTLHRPLRLTELGDRTYAVNGTPADCINLALHYLLPSPPRLVVSGINRGCNLGYDVNYSGTLAAALEGACMGVASFAVSLAGERRFDFLPAARFALRLAGSILTHGLPPNTLLNVNVPDTGGRPIERYRITRLGTHRHRNTIEQKTDPRGVHYYWIGRVMDNGSRVMEEDPTDYAALEQQMVSVTPLTIDRTNMVTFKALADWKF